MIDGTEMWMTSLEAVQLVQQFTKTRNDAIELLLDSLIGGHISAEGVPSDPIVRKYDQKVRGFPSDIFARHNINPDFWCCVTDLDRRSWSWSAGTFKSSAGISSKFLSEYFDVRFSVVDIRQFCDDNGFVQPVIGELKVDELTASMAAQHPAAVNPKVQVSEGGGKKVAGRPLSRKRDDWTAYLVWAVVDGRIFGNMTASDALAIIASDMADDGIDEVPRSTVLNTINAVLNILRRNGVESC
jgi:hypothetical protein